VTKDVVWFMERNAMRMKWRWIVAGTIAPIAGIVALCAWLSRPLPPGPGVTFANVERIEIGMPLHEVETILGGPTHATASGPQQITDNSPQDHHVVLLWSDMECDILVYLDRDGRVIAREIGGGKKPNWYDRMRKRVGF